MVRQLLCTLGEVRDAVRDQVQQQAKTNALRGQLVRDHNRRVRGRAAAPLAFAEAACMGGRVLAPRRRCSQRLSFSCPAISPPAHCLSFQLQNPVTTPGGDASAATATAAPAAESSTRKLASTQGQKKALVRALQGQPVALGLDAALR